MNKSQKFVEGILSDIVKVVYENLESKSSDQRDSLSEIKRRVSVMAERESNIKTLGLSMEHEKLESDEAITPSLSSMMIYENIPKEVKERRPSTRKFSMLTELQLDETPVPPNSGELEFGQTFIDSIVVGSDSEVSIYR